MEQVLNLAVFLATVFGNCFGLAGLWCGTAVIGVKNNLLYILHIHNLEQTEFVLGVCQQGTTTSFLGTIT